MTIQCEIKHPINHPVEKGFLFSGLHAKAEKFFNNIKTNIANTLEKQRITNERRAALKDLAGLSDETLKDIGISRDNAKWAFNKSTANDTSEELEIFLAIKKACR